MDSLLCDELLQEIFHRLPPSSSSSSVSLVSKRWLRLLRSSTSTLSLTFTPPPPSSSSISSFLSSHPYLSSLSLNSNLTYPDSDHLLRSVAFSCPNLKQLRFFPHPVSLPALFSLSSSCPLLTSLKIGLSRPLFFNWLTSFHSLTYLKLFITTTTTTTTATQTEFQSVPTLQLFNCQQQSEELNLLSLSISGIRVGDNGLNWLWRNCKQLNKLKLAGCQSVGDDPSFTEFIKCVKGLQQVELRTCRAIVDRVLLKLAEYCISLDSLSVYDGCSKQGLLQFIEHNRCRLKKLDLRLPLDLDDDHLFAIAENFTVLSSLRLQSCCLVTGEGLKRVASGVTNKVPGLNELSLINCGAIQRESGLLTTFGQTLKNLKMVDLSYNEKLNDKELTSMMVSCCNLNKLKLRGCNSLTDAALTSVIRCCKKLEVVDLVYCRKISGAAVEVFVMKCRQHLKEMHIEANKVNVAAVIWASTSKYIQIVA